MKLDAIELTENHPRRSSGIGDIDDLKENLTEFFDDSSRLGEGHGSLMRKPPSRLVSNFYFNLVNNLTKNNDGLDWKTLINATEKQIKRQKRLEQQRKEEQEAEEEEEEEEEDEETKNKKRLANIVARWTKITFKNFKQQFEEDEARAEAKAEAEGEEGEK